MPYEDRCLLITFFSVFYFMLCCFRENLLTPDHKSGEKVHSCLVRRYPILLILPSFSPAFFHLFFNSILISFPSSSLPFFFFVIFIVGLSNSLFWWLCVSFHYEQGDTFIQCFSASGHLTFLFFLVNYIDRLVNAEN